MSSRHKRPSRASHAASAAIGTAGRPMSRRAWLGVAAGGAVVTLLGERWWRTANPAVLAADATPITVYASPTCNCCHKWVKHLERNSFLVTVENLADVTTVKRRIGVPEGLWSCHTAMVAGYAVEGHVPADVILKLLRERPAFAGIAAPGMPAGAPGMEGAGKDAYDILAFDKDGQTQVYASR